MSPPHSLLGIKPVPLPSLEGIRLGKSSFAHCDHSLIMKKNFILTSAILSRLHSLLPTSTSPNAISVQGCKSTTLRWWREPIGAGMWNSLFKFTVSGIYSGTIPPHQDPFRFSDYCSNDGIFCVRHIMGPASWAVNFTYGERVYIQPEISYNHTAPQIGNRNWDVEYWGCVLV